MITEKEKNIIEKSENKRKKNCKRKETKMVTNISDHHFY